MSALTNCNHEDFPGSDHVNDTIGVLKDLEHHLFLVFRGGLVLWVRTRVHDAIHVEVEVIKLLAVGIRLRGIDRDGRSIFHRNWLVLDHWRDDLGIP
jgi:hypothetical protein